MLITVGFRRWIVEFNNILVIDGGEDTVTMVFHAGAFELIYFYSSSGLRGYQAQKADLRKNVQKAKALS